MSFMPSLLPGKRGRAAPMPADKKVGRERQDARPGLIALIGALAASLCFSQPLLAQTIKIGEINSYATAPDFLVPYRNGWRLALDAINSRGGVNGRQIDVISRDDGGDAANAVREAGALVQDDGVTAIFGGGSSETGLALAQFAKQHGVVYLAAAPLTDKLVWQNGNAFTFRLEPSVSMLVTMIAPEAARLRKHRWLTVFPKNEYGTSAAAAFEQHLKALQPDAEFVAALATAPGIIDAAGTAAAIAAAKPDAIFNVEYGSDLTNLVRAGRAAGVFRSARVVSLLTGNPEYLAQLDPDVPPDWIVTGYPGTSVQTLSNKQFVAAYRSRYHTAPGMGAVVGYSAMMSLAAALKRAKSTDAVALADAFSALNVDTPFGPITYRAIDHQSTMGTFVGTTAVADSKGLMVGYRFYSGVAMQPSDRAVRKLRPAD